ncbi:MAG: hypothetical protein WCR26_06685 [Sphaerochaetaceae bacterium]
MKRLVVTLTLLLLTLTLFAAWWGGYRVAFDGLVGDSFVDNEYLSLEVTLRPFKRGPSLQTGVLVNLAGPPQWSVGLFQHLFVWTDHPLAPLFRRASGYSIGIGSDLLFNFSLPLLSGVRLTVEPLLFDFSDKRIALLGVHLLWDVTSAQWGWGLRLFEITHYLF